MKYFVHFSIIVIAFALFSCNQQKNEFKQVDVSKIELQLTVSRMDKDMFENINDTSDVRVKKLNAKYGGFFTIYCMNVMRLGNPIVPGFSSSFTQFAKNKDLQDIFSKVKVKYPDVKFLDEELTSAFKHYKFYFPKKTVPKVVATINGFVNQVITDDSTLAVALEMYMGKDFKEYTMLGLPMYKIRKLTREYITTDCMRGWIVSEFPDSSVNNDLLNKIIYQGKIQYLLDALIPETNDTLKTGFSANELKWCEHNESNIWAFFIENKLLYNSDVNEIRKYIEDGPFTSTISKDSPARIGAWTGWQIVKSYMHANPKMTIAQLMEDNDGRKILVHSKYRPKN